MRRKRRDQGAPAPPSPEPLKRGISWLLPAALAAVLYLPSLQFPFIGLDDTLLILANQAFLRDLANLPRAFLQDAWHVPGYPSSGVYYRPLYTVSFMLDAQLGGTAPTAYHLTNVALHALASVLFLAFLRKLRAPAHPALLLSLLFAAHPALTSVVAWVPGRNDSLLAAFALPALMALVDFHDAGRVRDALKHLAFVFLALLTKEAALALPLLAAGYLFTIAHESWRSRKLRLLVGGWALALLAYALLRRAALGAGNPAAELRHLAATLADNAVVLVHYLGKAMLPVGLALLPDARDTSIVPGLAALLALLVALRWSPQARASHALFGALFFVALLAPTLVVPVLVGLEQRIYLPLAGLALVLLEIKALRDVVPGSLGSRILIALVVAFALRTGARLGAYQGREAFWQSAVKTAPHSSLAEASLCGVQLDAGSLDAAESHCRSALALNPAEPIANNNLGVIQGRRGRPAEALPFFERELAVNPGYVDAWYNRGVALKATGDAQGARASWTQALTLDPGNQRALSALAAPGR